MQVEMLNSVQVTMQSHELVVKCNSVSQTSKVQRVKIKKGRRVYTECPWQIGWNPSSSRTTSGPLTAHVSKGPLRWRLSVSLPHDLHSGCAGTCWFHLLTTTVVKLLSFIRPLILQSPWPLYALDHYNMYKVQDWGGDEREEEEEGSTSPSMRMVSLSPNKMPFFRGLLLIWKLFPLILFFSYFHKTTSLKEQK